MVTSSDSLKRSKLASATYDTRHIILAQFFHGIRRQHHKENRFLELLAHLVAVGCIVRFNPGFHLFDAKKLVCEHGLSAK